MRSLHFLSHLCPASGYFYTSPSTGYTEGLYYSCWWITGVITVINRTAFVRDSHEKQVAVKMNDLVVGHLNKLPKMRTDRSYVTKQILQLTLEIIYLLTGEEYGPLKKKPSTSQSTSLIAERWNDRKILSVTSKIIDLLTGEEEWEYLEGHKDQYKDEKMEKPLILPSPDPHQANKQSEEGITRVPREDQKTKLPTQNTTPKLGLDNSLKEEFVTDVDISTPPGLTQSPATHIKEELSDNDDDVIITKILISTESSSTEYHSKKHCKLVGDKKHENITKTHNGFYNNCASSALEKRNRTFECLLCQKCFMSSSELSEHQLTHAETRTFICSVCGKGFATEAALADHLVSHINTRTATVCPRDVPLQQNSVLYSHLTENEPFQCQWCEETFGSKLELSTHQLDHFKKPFTCTECKRSFLSKSGLVTHQKTHVVQKQYDCPTCGKAFLSRSNLQLHQEVHAESRPSLGSETEAKLDVDSGIIVHQVDELFPCVECGDIFDSSSSLLQHQQSHSVDNPYVCLECGKGFNRKSSLTLHRRVIHQGDVCFSCPDCGKGFSCHSELVRHIRVHTGEQPYSCSQCGKSFSFKSALVRHQRIHSGNRPHSCSVCGKGFSCNSALQRHRTIHMKDNFLF